MKALFINACVREDSRTRELCEVYIRKHWTDPETEITTRELEREEILPLNRERLLRRDQDIAEGNLASADYHYAREFAAAEEILIGAPYWDCSFPALLKIYLERICVNGIMFRYGPDGRPEKICAGKKLIVITTAGGYLPQNSSLEQYWKELCALFGIPELYFYKAEGLDILGNDPREILDQTSRSL